MGLEAIPAWCGGGPTAAGQLLGEMGVEGVPVEHGGP